jgi:hypothetical protein
MTNGTNLDIGGRDGPVDVDAVIESQMKWCSAMRTRI